MLTHITKTLTIFEGPDGSGKSTLAKEYAAFLKAEYVHFPALPRVTKGLARMYVEAMLPALLGHRDVVFDRSWLSELPYGVAFREGFDRMTAASRRMLERLAMRCGAVVVRCDPGWEAVRACYIKRRHLEMLADVGQLRVVYDLYRQQPTALPTVLYDYVNDDGKVFIRIVDKRMPSHLLDVRSAGNWDAEYVLVGDSFGERKDTDPFYQWPFASFSNEGCSQWLAEQLDYAHIGEFGLLWVNADQLEPLAAVNNLTEKRIIGLGDIATAKIRELQLPGRSVPHPQFWRRFNNRRPYPLVQYLGE